MPNIIEQNEEAKRRAAELERKRREAAQAAQTVTTQTVQPSQQTQTVTTPKPVQTTQTIQTSQPAQEQTQTVQMPQQTARQQLMATQKQPEKWYKGDTPTSYEIIGRIVSIGQTDKKKGAKLWEAYQNLASDRTSPLYNPYGSATNQAVYQLQALGYKMPKGATKEWIEKNKGLLKYARTGTGGTPLAPSQKSTKQQNAAYWYYKLVQAEQNTQQAELEWNALQEEVQYWAQRKDRNYSDDEILSKVDWSKYKTLTAMDEARSKGTPLQFNRRIGYDKGLLPGLIWAVRNNATGGYADVYAIKAAMGEGKGYEANQVTQEMLDPTSGNYNPYAVGNTLDEASLHFGMNWFDQDWLNQNKGLMTTGSDEDKRLYNQVYQAEKNTKKAEEEWDQLQKEIEYWAKRADKDLSKDEIMQMIDWKKYKTLTAMDESLESGQIMQMTRGVGYSRQAVSQLLESLRPNNKWQEDPEITARLDPTSDKYNPYAVSATLDDAALYFGVSGFDKDWLEKNRGLLAGNNETDKEYYQKVYQAEQTTLQAEQELEAMKQWINDQFKTTSNAQVIIDDIEDDPAYKTLWKMGESLQSGKLMMTTRPINFKWEEVKQAIRDMCDEYNAARPNAAYVHDLSHTLGSTTMVTGFKGQLGENIDEQMKEKEEPEGTPEKPVTKAGDMPKPSATKPPSPLNSPTQAAITQGKDNNIEAAAPTISASGTDEDKIVWETAYSSDYETCVQQITSALDNGTLGGQEAYDYILGRANTYAAQNYMGVLAKKRPYEDAMETLAGYQMQQEGLMQMIAEVEANLPNAGDAGLWKKFPQMVKDFRENNGNMEGYSEEEMNFFAAHLNDAANAVGNIDDDPAIASWVAEQLGPEYQELDVMNQQLEQLNRHIEIAQEQVNDTKPGYDEAVEQEKLIQSGFDAAARLAAINGADTERAYDLMAVMRYAYGMGGEYKATEWSAYSLYDIALQGKVSYDKVAEAAKRGQENYQKEIRRIEYVKEQLTQNGVQVDQSVVDNLDREIERLNRESKAADYFLARNEPGFIKTVKQEKNKIDSAFANRSVWDTKFEGYSLLEYFMLHPDQLDHAGSFGESRDAAMIRNMSNTERDTYVYLRATQGQEAAQDYYLYLTDDTYGVVNTRRAEENQKYLQRFSEQAPVMSMIMSIIESPAQMMGTAYSLVQGATGGEINPYSIFFDENVKVSSMRSGAKETMLKSLDPNGVGYKIASIGYDALTSSLESAENYMLFGGALGSWATESASIGAKAVAAFTSSTPMGFAAAGSAIQDVKMRGGTDTQALLMGGVTFLSETLSEAITTQNTSQILFRKDVSGVKSIIKKFMAIDAVEEFVGESVNEWSEGKMDDVIMGELSNRSENINKYRMAGMTKEEAEAAADKDFWHNVLVAGITGAVSSGAHTVLNTFVRHVNDSRTSRRVQEYVDNNVQQALDNAIARQEGTQATQQENLEALQGQVNAYADRVNEVGDQAVGLATQAREAQQAAQAEQDQNVQWDQNDTLTPAQRQEKSKRLAQANFSLKQRRNNDGSYYTATLDAEGNIVADRQVFPDGHEEQLYTPGQTENKIILEPAPQRQVAPKEMRKADATERTVTLEQQVTPEQQTAPQEPAPHPDQQVNPRAMVVQDATTRTATEQATSEAPQEQPAPHPDQQVNPREMRLDDATTLTPQETTEQNTTEQNTAEQTTEQQNTAEPAQHPGQQVNPRELKVDNATERTGTPAQTQEAPQTAPEAPQRVRRVKADKIALRLGRDIVALSEATETKNDVSKASTIAGVLTTGEDTTISSTAAQHMVSELGGDKAATVTKDILLTAQENGISQEQAKTAITVAALGNGVAGPVFQQIAQEGATIENVNLLAQMAQADLDNPTVMQNVEQAGRENQISQQMRTDAGDGSMNAIKPYERAEAKTRKREMKARKALDKATQAVIAKGAAVSSLYQQMMADPTNAELRGQWQQAMNDLVGAKRVQEEYQQSYENASEDHTKAAQDLQDIRNRTMTEARQQAAETVDTRIAQQQEERAVQKYEQSVNETEEQRAARLQDTEIEIAQYNNIEGLSDDELISLERKRRGEARKFVKTLLEKFNVLKQYTNPQADMSFFFGKNQFDESLSTQTRRGKSYVDFSQLLTSMDAVVSNAIPTESHADKKAGTVKQDLSLDRIFVFTSAIQDKTGITPVELIVKTFNDGKDSILYVASTLEKIKETGVRGLVETSDAAANDESSNPRPVSKISIPELISKINPIDGEFLKYIPDSMLTPEQLHSKNVALEQEENRIAAMPNAPGRNTRVIDNQGDQRYNYIEGVDGIAVQRGSVDQGQGLDAGQLPGQPGRNDGRGNNLYAEPGTGQGLSGRGTESQTGNHGSIKGRVPTRLLSIEGRNNLTQQGVTDMHLQEESNQERFSSALDEAKASNDHGAYVDSQSVEALKEKGAIMIVSEDGLAGAAVGTQGNEKGNIFAVFKNKASKAKKASAALIIQAIDNGGNKLDCYDGNLSTMYQKTGMIPVARVAFNEEFMPKGWNVERDDHPDIVFWMHNGDSADVVAEKFGLTEEKGGYHKYTTEEIKALPLFDDATNENGGTEYGYDRAWAYRDQILAQAEAGRAAKAEKEQSNIQPLRMTTQQRQAQTQATPQGTQQTTPKRSPAQIATDLAGELGIGHSIGTRKMNNLPRSVAGYYEQRARYVAVRNNEAGNYMTTSHEIFHHLGQRLGMTGTQGMVNNLDPAFAQSYQASQLPGEAFAEFGWRWMQSDQAARQFAGDDFVDTFEDSLRKNGLWNTMNRARTDMQAYLNANAAAKIGSTIKNRSEANKKNSGIRERFTSWIASFADRTAAAEPVAHMIREQSGGNLNFDVDIRRNALLTNFSSRVANSILTGDMLTDSMGNKIGESLAQQFDDAGITAKDMPTLVQYMLAKHSLDRDAQGKPVFDTLTITPGERQAFIQDIEQNHPEIANAAKGFQAFRKQFIQAWLVDTNLLKQEAFDQMEAMYPNYVPTQRVMDQGQGRKGNSGTYQIRRAKGGTQDIINPMESFADMVNSIVSMVRANKVAQAWDTAYHTYEGLGLFGQEITQDMEKVTVNTEGLQKKVADLLNGEVSDDIFRQVVDAIGTSQSQWRGTGNVNMPNVLTVHKADGTKAYYKITNQELYNLLANQQDNQVGPLLKKVAKLTRGMSALTTGSNPVFAIRNFMRDFQTSVNYGSWASNYLTGAAKWLRAAYDVWRNNGEYKDYVALGGGGWTRIETGTKQGSEDVMRGLFKGYDRSTTGRTAKWVGQKLWNTITAARLNEVVEQTSRYVEYLYGKHDKSTAEGRQQAFLDSQEVSVDFARSGNGKLAAEMKAIIPFFGASLQGVYRTSRMLTENERGRAPARFAKTVINTALMSALAAGLMIKFSDDDEKEAFQNMSDDLKAQHFYFPNFAPDILGNQPLIRVPIGQDPLMYAVNGAVTNLIWDKKGGATEPIIDIEAIAETILGNLNPINNTVFDPLIATQTNKNWYGSRIIPSRLEDLDPSVQYTEDTPDIFVTAGRATGVSPLMLQYLAEQYTGFLGQMAIPAMSKDKHTGELGGVEAAINAARKRLTSDPLVSNDVVGSFYDGFNFIDSVVSTAKKDLPLNMLRRGLTPEEADAAYQEGYSLTRKGGLLYETKQTINTLYGDIDKINANQTLNDEEKYQLTSAKRQEMIRTALVAQEAIGAYKEKYVTGRNIVTDALYEGTYHHIPTAYETFVSTFGQDADQPYMKMVMEVWNATEKETALPHLNYTFSEKKVEYSVPENLQGDFASSYKIAYQKYLTKNAAKWTGMTPEEKLDVLKSAHTAGNNAAKKWFVKYYGAAGTSTTQTTSPANTGGGFDINDYLNRK